MKKFTTSLFLLGLVFTAKAQVGVGTTDPKATLDVVGKTGTSLDGIIAPRFTGDDLDAKTYTTAQTGALVYVTAARSTSSISTQIADVDDAGYYYFNGTKWVKITINDWHITGNVETTPGTNFLGTTDNKDLVFKRFGIVSGVIGTSNTSYGNNSLPYSDTNANGTYNTAIGLEALKANTGNENVGIGRAALNANTGSNNIALGSNSMSNNTGNSNIGIGENSLKVNTGLGNVAVGSSALLSNTSGVSNVAIGASALNKNTTSHQNVAIGGSALYSNQTGPYNTGVGYQAGMNNTGGYNTFIGNIAMSKKAAGDNNIAIGYNAGFNQTAGNNNIVIGSPCDLPVLTGNNQLNIANIIYGTGLYQTYAKIGIGITAPTSNLHVNGTFAVPIESAKGAAPALGHTILATGNVTLPAASSSPGRIYVIVYDGVDCTISGGGGLRKNGTDITSYDLNSSNTVKSITIQSNGSKWVIIATSQIL